MSLYQSAVLSQMIGQTPVEITGLKEGSESVTIRTKEGNELILRYEPDCSASCTICQVDGDADDLLRAPLLMCEEVTEGLPEEAREEYEDSFTWTFVKLATVKGYVTLRWYGSSNGYYSESPTAYYNGEDESGRKNWRFS